MKWCKFSCSESSGALCLHLISYEHLLDLGSYLAQTLVLIESQKSSWQKLGHEDYTYTFLWKNIRRLKTFIWSIQNILVLLLRRCGNSASSLTPCVSVYSSVKGGWPLDLFDGIVGRIEKYGWSVHAALAHSKCSLALNPSCNYYFRVPMHVGMYTEVVCTKVELWYSTHETYIMSETKVTLIEKRKCCRAVFVLCLHNCSL